MASRFLIAVGGSGQHIALAVTRLVYMGALESDIQLIAIDPDNKQPISQRLESPAGMSGKNHPLKQGQVYTPFDLSKYGKKTFAAMFVDESNPDERELFESMFEEHMDSIPVHQGMYGTPCVGATVFAEGARSASFANLLAPVQNATSVYICGSVVGGTGAGITHKLISELRRHYNGPMFGVFMLPWFKVQNTTATVGTITNADIQRNATHGLKYFYEHTIPALTSSVLVGYPENFVSQVLRPITVGTGDMGNEQPHFLHLIASHGFATLVKASLAHKDVKAYAIAHHPAAEDWLLSAPWENGTGLLGRDCAHTDTMASPGALDLRTRIRAHQVVLNLLKYLTADKRSKELLAFYGGGVLSVFASNTAWGDDLHASIVNSTEKGELRKTFVKEMINEFNIIAQEVELCVEWAQHMFPAEMLRMPHGDALLDRLKGGEASQLVELRSMWKGRGISSSQTNKPKGAQVARSHAKFILDAALKV